MKGGQLQVEGESRATGAGAWIEAQEVPGNPSPEGQAEKYGEGGKRMLAIEPGGAKGFPFKPHQEERGRDREAKAGPIKREKARAGLAGWRQAGGGGSPHLCPRPELQPQQAGGPG